MVARVVSLNAPVAHPMALHEQGKMPKPLGWVSLHAATEADYRGIPKGSDVVADETSKNVAGALCIYNTLLSSGLAFWQNLFVNCTLSMLEHGGETYSEIRRSYFNGIHTKQRHEADPSVPVLDFGMKSRVDHLKLRA